MKHPVKTLQLTPARIVGFVLDKYVLGHSAAGALQAGELVEPAPVRDEPEQVGPEGVPGLVAGHAAGEYALDQLEIGGRLPNLLSCSSMLSGGSLERLAVIDEGGSLMCDMVVELRWWCWWRVLVIVGPSPSGR
jgi:hypothetical protein